MATAWLSPWLGAGGGGYTPPVQSPGNDLAGNWRYSRARVVNLAYAVSSLAGYASPITLPFVLQMPMRKAERQPSDGVYTAWNRTFKIPAELISFTPKMKDKITDTNGTVWTLDSGVSSPKLGSTWNCSAIYLEINHDLAHTITWSLPAPSTDSYGSPIITPSNLAPMDCAIQEMSKEEIIYQGVVQGFRYHYSIWIEDELRLPFGTVGTDERGYVYQVQSQRTRNRLDDLNEILAIINP